MQDNNEITTTCCICGQVFIGHGHNPWPVSEDAYGRCCSWCNATKVVPARIVRMMEKEDKHEK